MTGSTPGAASAASQHDVNTDINHPSAKPALSRQTELTMSDVNADLLAAIQIFEWCETEGQLRGKGYRLSRDKHFTAEEKAELRKVYTECQRAMELLNNDGKKAKYRPKVKEDVSAAKPGREGGAD